VRSLNHRRFNRGRIVNYFPLPPGDNPFAVNKLLLLLLLLLPEAGSWRANTFGNVIVIVKK
jgi:hypothetical protein